MGEITITFWGICTIIRTALESTGQPRRIALVDASHDRIAGNAHLAGHQIKPHVARLRISTAAILAVGAAPVQSIPTEGAMVLRLAQVTLAIPNADPQFGLEDAAGCLPHLGLMSGGAEFLGPPTPATETGGPSMAAIFELKHGILAGLKSSGGAGLTVLTVRTAGDPVLTLTPFGTKEVTKFTLRSGASILVMNLPEHPESDHEADFLLHFLTATVFPADAGAPGEVCCPPGDHIDDGGLGLYVGPGCSNSNYP